MAPCWLPKSTEKRVSGLLGRLLGALGGVLERLGGVLERLGRVLGRLGAENEPSGAVLSAWMLRVVPRIAARRRPGEGVTSKEEGNLLKENIQKIFGTLQTRLQQTQTRS